MRTRAPHKTDRAGKQISSAALGTLHPIRLAVSIMLPSIAMGTAHAALGDASMKNEAGGREPMRQPGTTPGPDAATPAANVPVAARAADAVVFDAEFLMRGPDGARIDTTRFARGNPIDPGIHRLDLLVNSRWRGVEDIEFRPGPDTQQDASPCFTRALLERAGIDLQKAAQGQDNRDDNPMPEGIVCAPLSQYVPGIEVRIDIAEQKLYLTLPKFFLQSAATPYSVDPSNWDSGITAARLNYYANAYHTENTGASSYTSAYASLDTGFNAGRIRIRHNGSVSWQSPGAARYQRGMTYAQTDILPWRAQLLIGESSTGSEFFDSVSFRGARISSDDRMLPTIHRTYAPIVRGTATSNARVTIFQRGYQVYETTVAPGPFVIDDLQIASYGGDLEVRVTEANGQTQTFTVPFATAVQLMRPGTRRFSVTMGQTNDPYLTRRQPLFQATLQQGLSNDLTAYGGAALTERYLAAMTGAAFNTSIGAVTGDVTFARTASPGGDIHLGSSYRFSFSKNFPDHGTHFSLLAYRYSTRNYFSLSDAVTLRDRMAAGLPMDFSVRPRNRLDANLSQYIGRGAGNLYLTGSAMQYWNQSGNALSFTLGYSNQWRNLSYSLSAQRTWTQRYGTASVSSAGMGPATIFSLNISLPLGRDLGHAPSLSLFTNSLSHHGTQTNASLSDMFGARSQGSYNVSASHDSQNQTESISGSLNYRLPQADLGASISWSAGTRQVSLGASGGLIAHQNGLIATPPLSETIGIVHAPDAAGARLGHGEATIDQRGYAAVPSLSAYQINVIDLEPAEMSDEVELQLSSRSIAPRAGAIVKLSYPTRRAIPILIDSRQANGDPLPFAATVVDVRTGEVLGAVGQGSRLVIRSRHDQGSVRVEWGNRDRQCLIHYALPPVKPGQPRSFQFLNLPCQAPGPLATIDERGADPRFPATSTETPFAR